MNFKRAMMIGILVLAILLTATGCGCGYKVEITENGGSVEQYFLITASIVESMRSAPSQEAEGFDWEEVAKAPIVEIDGTKFHLLEVGREEFTSLEALAQQLNEMNTFETVYFACYPENSREMFLKEMEEQGGYIPGMMRDVSIQADKRSGSITMSGWVLVQDTENSVPYIMDLKFPGKILEHTIGQKIDDTTLRLSLEDMIDAESDLEFTVRAELPNGNGGLMAVLVCAAVAVGGFAVYKKRCASRKTLEPGTEEAKTEEEQPVEAPAQEESC